jgi:hypothetical protein
MPDAMPSSRMVAASKASAPYVYGSELKAFW